MQADLVLVTLVDFSGPFLVGTRGSITGPISRWTPHLNPVPQGLLLRGTREGRPEGPANLATEEELLTG